MLVPYRVLELTNENVLLCGQILADLGADVSQIEPPGGSSTRSVGPWFDGERGPARRSSTAVMEALARGDRRAALQVLAEVQAAGPGSPEATLELAKLLIAAGEAPQAVWVLEAAIGRFPGRYDLYVALGGTALLVGDASRARKLMEAIPIESEQHAKARVILGRAELELGDLDRALEIFEQAEQLYPDSLAATFARIVALIGEKRFAEARQALDTARESEATEGREALERLAGSILVREASSGEGDALDALFAMAAQEPDDPRAWGNLFEVLHKLKRLEEALEPLRAALDANPEVAGLYPLLAAAYSALERPEDSIRVLRRFTERLPSAASYLALATAYVSADRSEDVLELYREALEAFPGDSLLLMSHTELLITLGLLDEAQTELKRFRAEFPQRREATYLQARLELANGDAASAVKRLEKLTPDFDTVSSQFWLGVALEATGDFEAAEMRYRIAATRDRSQPAPYLATIRMAERRGDWRSVAGHAKKLVNRVPTEMDGWRALVFALSQLEEGRQAENAAKKAQEQFPDLSEPHVLLALALRTQGRYPEALSELDLAAERGGPTPELEAERALTLGLSGEVEAGITAARKALGENPGSAHLQRTLAALLFAAGDEAAGSAAVDRARELDPDDPIPLRVRAEYSAATGKLDQARADCESYLAARPDDPKLHFVLGVVHAKAGRRQLAIASYRRAAELDDHAYRARNNLAELLGESGDLEGALEAAQQAHAIQSDSPVVQSTLGDLYRRKGLLDRAISLLEGAHAAAPELAEVRQNLALAYRDAGRSAEAEQLMVDSKSQTGRNAGVDERTDTLESVP